MPVGRAGSTATSPTSTPHSPQNASSRRPSASSPTRPRRRAAAPILAAITTVLAASPPKPSRGDPPASSTPSSYSPSPIATTTPSRIAQLVPQRVGKVGSEGGHVGVDLVHAAHADEHRRDGSLTERVLHRGRGKRDAVPLAHALEREGTPPNGVRRTAVLVAPVAARVRQQAAVEHPACDHRNA